MEWLDLKGNIVTIDAMGCQYEIGNQILKQEGQYIFSLKGNQGNLHDDVKTWLSNEGTLKNLKSPKDHDKGHGRIETRTCWVDSDVAWIHKRHPHWRSIKSVIRVDSCRETKGKISNETRYYITSLAVPAEKVLMAIRSHWAIENNLHWVLDMSFGEGRSRIRKHNAP